MKRKINIKDKETTTQKEIIIPNKMHFEAQLKYPSRLSKDKTKYTRKKKHRKNPLDE